MNALTPLLDQLIERPMTAADIAAVRDLELRACLHPLHAWSDDNYLSSLKAGYWARVRCHAETGQIVAVCVAMDGVDEMHLLNIAVDKSAQGQGVAREVMRGLYALCRQRGARALWLEVRPSNTPARALYERQGFVAVGRRKNYYPAPQGREDAIVMRRDIEERPQQGGAS